MESLKGNVKTGAEKEPCKRQKSPVNAKEACKRQKGPVTGNRAACDGGLLMRACRTAGVAHMQGKEEVDESDLVPQVPSSACV